MSKEHPWGDIEIPKALEKEHKAKIKKEAAQQKKILEHKAWFKDFWSRYNAPRNPYEELTQKGYTMVNGKEELLDVLQAIIDKEGPVDVVLEEKDDDKKDLP